MPTADRRILERQIFRDLFQRPGLRRVMLVGCSQWTSWYPRVFALRRRVIVETVDSEPAAAAYGAKGARHHVARLESLGAERGLVGSFDVIVLNGVLGYGTDTPAAKREALRSCACLLRAGGALVIGYGHGSALSDLEPDTVDDELFRAVPVPGFRETFVPSGHHNGHAFVCFERTAVPAP